MAEHDEILKALEAPFPAEVIRHRVGAGGKDLQWVDARTVAARLDAVLGLGGWDFTVERVGDTNAVLGMLRVRLPGGAQATRSDFGYETGGSGESLKEASSDSLRRCASLFGVARALYGGQSAPAARIPAPTGTPARQAAPSVITDDEQIAVRAAMLFSQVDAGGSCSHGNAWSLKPAGVAKSGRPYPAFWAASHKVGEGWCQEKPGIAWVNAQVTADTVKAEDEDLSSLPF